MNPALVNLLILILAESPKLAVQLMAIWHKQGKVTTEEIAAFIAEKWPDAESFFRPGGNP